MQDALGRGVGGWVVTYNVDILRRFTRDPGFAGLVSEASLNVADGMPLVWAARIGGARLPERVCGADLLPSLAPLAARAGWSMYLVGGNPGTAEQSVELLRQRHPAIRIAGHLCPEMGFEADPERLAAVITAIASARPDIVFVALGSPKQERLIAQLRRLLPATWFIGVGAAFSFLTGDIARAPAWMRRSGLEWLHRLLQEPGRLARRYLVENAPYAAGLLLRSAARRVTGRRGTVRRPLAD